MRNLSSQSYHLADNDISIGIFPLLDNGGREPIIRNFLEVEAEVHGNNQCH